MLTLGYGMTYDYLCCVSRALIFAEACTLLQSMLHEYLWHIYNCCYNILTSLLLVCFILPRVSWCVIASVA